MSKNGLPDPLGLHKKGGIGLPDPLGIMEGSKETIAKQEALAGLKAGAVPDRNAPPSDPAIAKRASEQFATRDQDMQRKAAAAGALRSENDADLLGYSAPKKRGAARMLLG